MDLFYKTPLFKNYIKEARTLLERWHKEGKKYLIYGAGIHSKELLSQIKPHTKNFLGFIDQSLSKQKGGFIGFPVFSLEKAVKTPAVAILVSSYEYQESMKDRILEFGSKGLEIAALYPTAKLKDNCSYGLGSDLVAPSIVKKNGRRIAVLDTFFSWPPRGGSAVDLAAVMDRLAKTGFQVALFLPVVDDALYYPRGHLGKKRELGFDVYQIPIKASFFSQKYFTEEVAQAVEEYDPEFVFLGDIYALKPFLAERLKKYKIVWRSYNHALICPKITLFNNEEKICPNSFLTDPGVCRSCVEADPSVNWDQPIYREIQIADFFSDYYCDLLLKNMQRAKGLIVYNEMMKERLMSRLPDNKNIYVIPTGIEPEHFAGNGKKNDETFTIFLPGRLDDPAKGFDYFLKVFHRLKEKYPGIRLLTTGKFDPGVEGVECAGWTSYEKIQDLYKMAHICVVPSIWEEPFGIVALEAMASEIPVVANAVGGLKEIVRDGETGFLVPPADSGKFFDSLSLLIDSKEMRTEMGKKGKLRAAGYSWEKVMEKYKDIFDYN